MKYLAPIFLITLIIPAEYQAAQVPKVGNGVNILSKHGLMNSTITHSNGNDISSWIFRDPQFSIFKYPKAAPTNYNNLKTRSGFYGEFQIELCRTYDELMEAFYKNFDIEGLFRPYSSIVDSFEEDGFEKTLGIPHSFLKFGYTYAFLKLSRFHENKHLFGDPYTVVLHDDFERSLKNITTNDVQKVKDFIEKHGTHFISSYVSGNSVYQIFVYKRRTYLNILSQLQGRELWDLEKSELENLFSSNYVEFSGRIQTSSRNSSVESWAKKHLRVPTGASTLLKAFLDSSIQQKICDRLGDEMVLQMTQRSIAPFIRDITKRQWFLEVVDNLMKLWEVDI